MINFFDLSTKHTIIDVNRNKYVIPTLHPNSKMSMHDFIYMLDGRSIDERQYLRKRVHDILSRH